MLSRLPTPPFRGAPGAMSVALMIAVAALVLGQPAQALFIAAAIGIGIWQFLETNAINRELRDAARAKSGSKFAAQLMDFYRSGIATRNALSNSKVTDADVD